ncbi:MAG: hypothetical protein AAF649_03975 [Verrucomicrobiota bacterium]
MRMLKKSVVALAGCFLLLSASFQVVANQPHWDDGYRIFQDHSPNFIHVEILNVNVTSNKALWFASHSDRVEVEARVLKVVRTTNDLRPGMIIPILYDRKAAAGGTLAETPGIPEKGQILPAFIKLKGDHYIPAARHHTFSPLAEQQLKQMDRESVELTEAQIAALRLPEELSGSLQVDTSSDLPLEPEVAIEVPASEPVRAEIVEPEVEVTVASAELPMVDPETPGIITPTIPETDPEVNITAETPVVDAGISAETQTETPIARAEVVTTAEMEVETPSIVEKQPMIDNGSVSTEAKPKRRTVVVVPPSELRSRRQQEIQSALNQELARREAEMTVTKPVPLPEAPVPVLKAEVVTPPSPATKTLTEAVDTPEVPEAAPLNDDPVRITLSNAEATVDDTVPYPVLRAEIVEMPQTQPASVRSAQVPADSQQAPVAGPAVPMTAPAAQVIPPEEPITITDFTPPTAATSSDPVANAVKLTERDRLNMKSYADIYLSLQQAGDAAGKQDYSQAKELYQKALNDLQTLRTANPDFQPFMVEYRIRDTSRKLEQLVVNAPRE